MNQEVIAVKKLNNDYSKTCLKHFGPGRFLVKSQYNYLYKADTLMRTPVQSGQTKFLRLNQT